MDKREKQKKREKKRRKRQKRRGKDEEWREKGKRGQGKIKELVCYSPSALFSTHNKANEF